LWPGDRGVSARLRRQTPTHVFGWHVDLLRKVPESVIPAPRCAGLPELAPWAHPPIRDPVMDLDHQDKSNLIRELGVPGAKNRSCVVLAVSAQILTWGPDLETEFWRLQNSRGTKVVRNKSRIELAGCQDRQNAKQNKPDTSAGVPWPELGTKTVPTSATEPVSREAASLHSNRPLQGTPPGVQHKMISTSANTKLTADLRLALTVYRLRPSEKQACGKCNDKPDPRSPPPRLPSLLPSPLSPPPRASIKCIPPVCHRV
jgi:hypothetical protein